jgi:SPP1 gp7 family putative phage head morphogenesis protein
MLTRRKKRWVNKRKPDAIQGKPINVNIAVQARYHERLDALVRRMVDETERRIMALYRSGAFDHAMDASKSSAARILTNELMRKFNAIFRRRSKPIAETFANQADAASSAAVHASLKELSGGLSLPVSALNAATKEILSATITENVGLIRSISEKYQQQVQGMVMRSITSGGGADEIMESLQREGKRTYKRARFIVRDQTRKAMQGLSRGRMEKVGLKKFRWLHTGGSKEPRPLHVKMSGNIYRFDDPPIIDEKTGERGYPGQLPGCGCRQVPVIEFDDDA